MSNRIDAIARRFAQLHAVVIGEAMLDRYSTGHGRRICPEAPVPVIDGCSTLDYPGGAANAAANLAALGASVTFMSVRGDDSEGEALAAVLRERRVNVDHLIASPRRQTLSKHRVCAGDQMLLRFDQGTTAPVEGDDAGRLVAELNRVAENADVIVVSDYNYGVIAPPVIKLISALSRDKQKLITLDSRRLTQFRSVGVTAVKPNYREATELLGLQPPLTGDRRGQIMPLGPEILQRTGAQIAAVTLDDEGAVVFERGADPHPTCTRPAPHCKSAGAGDTFMAAFSLALAAGARTTTAADIAAAASAIVVHKHHTSSCSVDELLADLGAHSYPADLEALAMQMDRYRQAGKRIVFTNGCFDILHRGHVSYLQRARELGDVLVVGVNSDSSIRQLKGPERPINCLEDRLAVLAGLSCVDHLAMFDNLTPDDLIRAVRPHVFAKGGDYTRESLPEASLVEELGGRVVILPFVNDHSTTGIVAKIRTSWPAAPVVGIAGALEHV
jgi:D-beta-D-heptose 7-phosphate kinase/D-beta-D-heptose 1-phosphate adenosyltransferase